MRDEFSSKVKKKLASRTGYRCSNPKCRKNTSGPKKEGDGDINIGEAAHICAASKGGMRYDENMTSEERSSAKNGIWLCRNCAALIDRDTTYTVDILNKWKIKAEYVASVEITSNNKSDDVIVCLDNFDISIIDLISEVVEEGNTEYMLKEHDFHSDFQRRHLDDIFSLATKLSKPSKQTHNEILNDYICLFLKNINELIFLVSIKGGPSDIGNGSFIIDRKEDRMRCNDVCDNILNTYEKIIKFRNSFY